LADRVLIHALYGNDPAPCRQSHFDIGERNSSATDSAHRSCGVSVVAVAWGGPTGYIDETYGILIAPPKSPISHQGLYGRQEKTGG
jgi:hypothetical protein